MDQSNNNKKLFGLRGMLAAVFAVLMVIIPNCGKILDSLEKIFSLLNNSCQWYSLFNYYPPHCPKKPEERALVSPPDLLSRFQESDLPIYRIDYLYYDVPNKQWTETKIVTDQEIVVKKANFQLVDHQTAYQSTFERLNREISRSMAHAKPVIDYFGTCINHDQDNPRIVHNADSIEAGIAGIVDKLHTSNGPDNDDAGLVDAGERADILFNRPAKPTLTIDTVVKLRQHGIISILLEYTRNCNQLDGGDTIFRDAINVNLALPESERFKFYEVADLAPIFHECHDLEKVAVFSENGYILCYAKSETLNASGAYMPKQYDYLEIYRQIREPILRDQFDRLLKLPRL